MEWPLLSLRPHRLGLLILLLQLKQLITVKIKQMIAISKLRAIKIALDTKGVEEAIAVAKILPNELPVQIIED